MSEYVAFNYVADHFFVWTDISMLGHFQGFLWEGESVLHKSLGFFYRHRYTSDIIATLESFTSTTNFLFYPPPTAARFRHCTPLGATSHKMDSHRWSLSGPPQLCHRGPPAGGSAGHCRRGSFPAGLLPAGEARGPSGLSRPPTIHLRKQEVPPRATLDMI